MNTTATTNHTPVTYEMLRRISAELQKNATPLFEIWHQPPKRQNERNLVSRNKREGWFGGRTRGRAMGRTKHRYLSLRGRSLG